MLSVSPTFNKIKKQLKWLNLHGKFELDFLKTSSQKTLISEIHLSVYKINFCFQAKVLPFLRTENNKLLI